MLYRGILFRPDGPTGGAGAATPAATPAAAPGEVVGTTPGGVTVKASGVVEGQPAEALDFKAAGKAFLAAQGTAPATATVGGVEVKLAADADDDELATPPGDTSTATDGADPDPAAGDPPKVDDPPAAEFVSITLPGLAERGEEDLEADVSPELAERITRLRNDGMRRKAYDEAMGTVEQQRAELAAIDEALSVDPVGFAINHMTPERQLEVAKALVLEHFDALLPDLIKFDSDAAARQQARVELRDKMRGTEQTIASTTQAQQRAAAVMRATQALLPENVDPDVAREFVRDAERDLIEAHRSGRSVTPDAVPALLTRRLSLYGFTAGSAATPASAARSTPAAAPAAAADPAIARPVSDRAKAIADRKPAVARVQARIATTQAARRTAAAVAPPGAGAATVSVPVVSQTADVREASKELRRKGVAQTWAPSS